MLEYLYFMKALAMTVSCCIEHLRAFACQCTLTDCGIPNCIICDKVDEKCAQCREGYRVNDESGGCSGKFITIGNLIDALLMLLLCRRETQRGRTK